MASGSAAGIQPNLLCLSDEILLNIVIYLTLSDRISLSRVNQRFSNLCNDVSLMRYLGVSHTWTIDTDSIAGIFQRGAKQIQHLDLAHCYWFTSKTITKCVLKCPNLSKLDLRGCSMTPISLDKILSMTVSLKHLAVTDAGVLVKTKRDNVSVANHRNQLPRPGRRIPLDTVYVMSDKACETLKGLVEIILTIDAKCTRGLYVIPMCTNVTSLSILHDSSFVYRRCSCTMVNERIDSVLDSVCNGITKMYIDPQLLRHHTDIWQKLDTIFSSHPVIAETGLPFAFLEHFIVKNSSQSRCVDSLSVIPRGNKDMIRLLDNIRLPHTLDCFHIHGQIYPGLVVVGNYWRVILEQLTSVTSLLLPLELLEMNTEDLVKSGAMISSLTPVCSHVKHLSFLGSLCHLKGSISEQGLINTNELWNNVATNVTKGLMSLAVPTCFVLDKETSLKVVTGDAQSMGFNGHVRLQKSGQRLRVGESTSMRSPRTFWSTQADDGRDWNCSLCSVRNRADVLKCKACNTRKPEPSDACNGISTRPSTSSSAQSMSHESEGRLEQCVSSCPFLETFELMPWNLPEGAGLLAHNIPFDKTFCYLEHLVKDQHLVYISQWKYLTSLTLAWLPGIAHGKSLIVITKGCCRLRFLSLAFLGLHGGCVYMPALCEALKYAKSLQDLRVEQPYMGVNKTLCRALHHCTHLTRLCLVTNKSQFSPDGILAVFHECKRLCVLHLITGSSAAACGRLSTAINARYKKQRPALNICITTNLDKYEDIDKRVPLVHRKELTLLRSHVCEKPTGWDGLSPV